MICQSGYSWLQRRSMMSVLNKFICRFIARLSEFLWSLRATSRQTALQSVMPLHSLRVFASFGTPSLALLLSGCLFSIGCALG